MISIEFHTSDGRPILLRGDVPLPCTFQCVVPVKTYFPEYFPRFSVISQTQQGLGFLI